MSIRIQKINSNGVKNGGKFSPGGKKGPVSGSSWVRDPFLIDVNISVHQKELDLLNKVAIDRKVARSVVVREIIEKWSLNFGVRP